jgi:hypothetical protein
MGYCHVYAPSFGTQAVHLNDKSALVALLRGFMRGVKELTRYCSLNTKDLNGCHRDFAFHYSGEFSVSFSLPPLQPEHWRIVAISPYQQHSRLMLLDFIE